MDLSEYFPGAAVEVRQDSQWIKARFVELSSEGHPVVDFSAEFPTETTPLEILAEWDHEPRIRPSQ